MKQINDMSLYQKIELAIISWNIDGTKTAGTLTRKILKLIEDEKKIKYIQKDNINTETQ